MQKPGWQREAECNEFHDFTGMDGLIGGISRPCIA